MSIPSWPRPKDPDEKLDYLIDWAARVGPDPIASSTWDVPVGLTTTTNSFTANTATIWLLGGILGQTYTLTNHIVTSGGRLMDQSAKLKIRVK